MAAWLTPPLSPQTTYDVILWAAWWAGQVAQWIGVAREFYQGSHEACQSVAGACERVVAEIERRAIVERLARVKLENLANESH